MKTLSLIVAKSSNNVIGTNGKLPWHLPEDLDRFKRLTTGHTVIMGRKTWESLPDSVRPLPDRKNVVLTRNKFYEASGATVVHSIESALMLDTPSPHIFCIGGGSLYGQLINYATHLLLTKVHVEIEGDTFFPELDPYLWFGIGTMYCKDEESGIYFDFCDYVRAAPAQITRG